MKSGKAFWSIILCLAIIKFILPFILQSPVYELQRDEYLYYQQGQHLAIGYLENPPLLSWLASISSALGGSTFWIKFWPSLIGAGTLILTCLIVAEWGGKAFAQSLAGLSIIGGAFMRVHALFQPNILDIFFWTLSLYFLLRYLNGNNTRHLFLFAVSLAIGFWGKYSIVFLGAGLVLALLLTHHWVIFKRKKAYLAILLALILVLPNVVWQYTHRWPLVHHMEELQRTQLRFLNPMDFIKDQFLMLLPAILIWTAGLVWLFRQKQWRFLAYTYFLVIILLIAGRGKSYYALGIYPLLLAAGAVCWERLSQKRVWVRWALTAQVLVFALVFIPVLLPVWNPEKLSAKYEKRKLAKTGLLRWEDQKDHLLPQDFADMLGWKELTTKAENFYESLPDSVRQGMVIYCRNYGQAGALKFYGKDPGFRERVFSDNGSFLLWIPRMSFTNLLFIGRHQPEKGDVVFDHFQSVSFVDSVSNIYSRQLGDKIFFYANADPKASKLAQSGLEEKLKTFRR